MTDLKTEHIFLKWIWGRKEMLLFSELITFKGIPLVILLLNFVHLGLVLLSKNIKISVSKRSLMDFFSRPILCSYGVSDSVKCTSNFVRTRKG